METGRLFSYDGRRRQMIVSGDIWRELCLSSHWIQDALILRWGELTSDISRKAISPSEVIDRLLRIPVCERNVVDAKRVYLEMPSKECVWSGHAIHRTFDVDHVLPFSLWRNNDLWNLLPAAPRINREKGDALPTNALLKRRRDTIVTYWDALHQANPKRFEHEVTRFAGIRQLDLSKTFDVMLESVEVTALQRGDAASSARRTRSFRGLSRFELRTGLLDELRDLVFSHGLAKGVELHESLLGCRVDLGTPNSLKPRIRARVMGECVRVA